ncbi:MAG: DNA repair protein RadC [Victivallaceae bacterium]|nr:DNA repair protein RadC [Victivallaceae bacterium]
MKEDRPQKLRPATVVGHRGRLRAKFLTSNATGFYDYELLELLLMYAIPRKDVKPLAKTLLAKFDSLRGVLEASPEELRNVSGIGECVTALFLLFRVLSVRSMEEEMRKPGLVLDLESVVRLVRMKTGNLRKEMLSVFFLDNQNHFLGQQSIEGTVDHMVVYPREVSRAAITANASAVVVAHNHPSGVAEPSPEDRNLTAVLSNALKANGIRLIDHVIVGANEYFSFQSNRAFQ